MKNAAPASIFIVAMLLFMAVVGFTFREVDVAVIFSQMGLVKLASLFSIGLAFHVSFGVIMWVGFALHYKMRLPAKEMVQLPMMMHLFLYLMPMKGGMLFQVFYTRHRYGLDMSKGFSLGLTVFLASLLLTVVLGLALTYIIPVNSMELRTMLWAMGASVVGGAIVMQLLPANVTGKSGLVWKLTDFLVNVRKQLADQLKNGRLFVALMFTTAISVLVQAVWFWKTASALGIQSQLLPVLLVVLILRVILLIRILPGNLGVQEVMIGAVFAAAGFQMQEGLLIGVVTRLISVFWAATIGLAGLYSNLRYFSSDSISGLIRKVAGNDK